MKTNKILLISFISSSLFAATNLLQNPSFESGVSPWQNISSNNLTSAEAHSGSFCFAVITNATLEARQLWIDVDPGKTYVAWVWFKWNVFSGNGWGYDRFRIINGDWTELAAIRNLHLKYNTGIWNKVALTFSPPTNRVGIYFGLFGPKDNVDLYFDDANLMEKSGDEPPTVNPQADVYSGTAPLTVNFTSNADDSDGAIQYYYWEFGDGSRSISPNPKHTFYEKGTFNVELLVYDNDKNPASSNITITVSDSSAPSISIQEPTTANAYTTSASSISLKGVASASGSVAKLVWDNINTFTANAFPVPAHQTNQWDTGNISLKYGKNEILLTATDNNGRVQTTKIVVWRTLGSPAIKNIEVESTTVPLYSKYEASFTVDTVAENTFFEYDENPPAGILPKIGITVQGIFVSPAGVTNIHPAFFFTETENNGIYYSETTNSCWKIRFAPTETGVWNVSIKVQDASGSASMNVGAFSAVASDNPGFIKVSQKDWRYFEFDNGKLFWPLGPIYPIYETNYNTGLNFTRPWLGGRGAYSANWSRWISTAENHGNEGFMERLSFYFHYPSRELSREIFYPEGYRLWQGPWLDNKFAGRIKNNTNYKIKLRIKTLNILGPENTNYPYGLVMKLSSWPPSDFVNAMRDEPSLIPIINQTRGWHTIVTNYTTPSSVGSYIHLYLDNVTDGYVFVDEVSMKEILSDGSLGAEIIRNSRADVHNYVEQRPLASLDDQLIAGEQFNIYHKYVVQDKNDWVPNHLVSPGIFQDEGDGYFQTEGTKATWLQQQWWRYLCARYGYSVSVHSWELCNESAPTSVSAWRKAQEFANYMHKTDAHPHLDTTSFWATWVDKFWGDSNTYPDVDYADLHHYTGGSDPLQYDMAAWHLSDSTNCYAYHVGKPAIRAETGIETDPGYSLLTNDNPGIWFHNLLWAQLNYGGMSDPNYWFSRHYDKFDRTIIAKPFADFINSIPLNDGGYSELKYTSDNSYFRVIGQKNLSTGNAHAWIQNSLHTWRNVMGVENPQTITPQSGEIKLQLLPNANCEVYYYDTYGGTNIYYTSMITDAESNLVINISNLETDIALKIQIIPEPYFLLIIFLSFFGRKFN